MSDIINYNHEEAVAKMKEMAGDKPCFFCTFEESGRISARPMHPMEIDDEGNFWFFSDRDSHQNEQINESNRVQLLFANESKEHYLSVEGEADISTDRQKIDELWTGIVKTWFKGKDDPSLTVIKVTPVEASYWDTRHGKMIAFLKMIASAVTGDQQDDGVKGKIQV